ncbi:pseudouridine synthase [Mycoplasma tauri]|uniref:pseudouridine synthase n=1 Tax=Mycoplasma tauri TaxID=547987 RepID=UPI001CBAC860|nr:RluA family pseudouridine synthase [Mycoplasma tauri]MBZ4217990.1 RluA family pseudouridine synthase [Mycoplasma tauri]
MIKIVASKNDAGRKILKFLQAIYKSVPTSVFYKLFRKKDVIVNKVRIKDPNYLINEGDLVTIYGLDESEKCLYKFNENLILKSKIIYEDENILIVNKLPNVEVHGSFNSLDNQVLSYLKFSQESSFKPSHVGRLDKVTSGIMIYAKNYETLVELNNKTIFFEKIYTFKSDYKGPDVTLNLYLDHNENMKKMIAFNSKRNIKLPKIITHIFCKDEKQYAQIFTGKKHQIRATMEYLKNPIYGDVKYGGKRAKRVFLHCLKVTFMSLSGNLEYLNNKSFECKEEW